LFCPAKAENSFYEGPMNHLHDILLVRFVRRLRGGSQPIVVEGSDGVLYVVKFLNNPQGANVLFNEGAGSQLFGTAGLPVPGWNALLASNEFLDRNPECWMTAGEDLLRPTAGLCFGSRFLDGGVKRTLEILPGTSYKRLRRRDQLWTAWLLDACCYHSDIRQVLFTEEASGRFNPVFIDNGHLFGGSSGTKAALPRASQYLDNRIYRELEDSDIDGTVRFLQYLDTDSLRRKALALPGEWQSGSGISALERALNRLADQSQLRTIMESIVEIQRLRLELDTSRGGFEFPGRPSLLHPSVPRKPVGYVPFQGGRRHNRAGAGDGRGFAAAVCRPPLAS
jgi:hypothetical protein